MKLSDQYRKIRAHSEAICAPLQKEDYVVQPVVDVSPPKWHLGHTTWFFETFLLKEYMVGYKVYDADYNYVFNSYYETIGARVIRTDRGNLSRPSVDDVYKYRKYVDEAMVRFLDGEISDELLPVIMLGLNHEQQHQELLLTDIKYILGHNPLFPVYEVRAKAAKGAQRRGVVADFAEEWTEGFVQTHGNNGDVLSAVSDLPSSGALVGAIVSIKAGVYDIGNTGGGFCFDNELSRHKVYLNDFSISASMVTNGEYLEFVEADGYKDFKHWHSEGWDWVKTNGITAPMYWHLIDGAWDYYTLEGLKPVDMDEALCHVSFYEAAAFAAWKGMRLPTEAEWEIASEQFDWGERWEWTESAYLPYPGFKKAPGAIGEYNGKFMVNQMVLRGASVATPEGHSRHTYRNFFHPHLQWQFTGIRLVTA